MKIKLEDIYPLTIIRMRHGKYAVVEAESNYVCVGMLESDEETQYDPHAYMKKEWEHIPYGIGSTIQNAFEDFCIRNP